MGVQEVRWTLYEQEIIIFLEKKGRTSIRTRNFVYHRISAIETVGFVCDRMSYIILRARWCNIIVMSVHSPSEEKIGVPKRDLWEIRGGCLLFS